jgi:phosphohistidine phosphatase
MIVLVHHGEAVSPSVVASRPLSTRGLAEVARLAERAAARGVAPDVIWHSGKVRARQTAEAFWRVCNPLAQFSAARGLQPDDPPEWMRDQLATETRRIMLVGHMPHLPRLLAALCGEDPAFGDFPSHGCVALVRDGAAWKELWRIENRDTPP